MIIVSGLSHIQELRQNLNNLRVDRKSRSYRTFKKKRNHKSESGSVSYTAATPEQMEAIRLKIAVIKRRRRVRTGLVLIVLFVLAIYACWEIKESFNYYKPYNGRRNSVDIKIEKNINEMVWDTESPTYHVLNKSK